jgi:general nucleoside transport system ATP-binding protein
MPPALQTIGITKQFPGVLANDHIDFALEHGEIHALLGENGAGKSTLMNILYGLYAPDSGQVLINGSEVHLESPNDAIARGIGMVHQHFMLIPPLTVTENIILGDETLRPATRVLGRLALLDRSSAAARISELSAKYSLAVDPYAYVKDLTVGAQQRIEIIKALYRAADILILDEPTAVLTPQEADELFDIMRGLAKQGKSIIFITHKLREVFAVADRITVLRLGKTIGTVPTRGATQAQLAEMMVGRKVILSVEKREKEPGIPALAVAGLTVLNERRLVSVSNVSFEVHGGEVLGIAGVQGNGQTELADALTSLRKVESGTIRLLGHDITHASPRQVIEAGVAHIPEDRQKHGLVLTYPIADNLVLSTYYLPPFSHGIELDQQAIAANAETQIKKYDIRTPSALTSAGSLSGGNQQKVIVARELSRVTQVIIAAQPTRGLDVGSIEFIHKQLIAARDFGVAVLLISAELDEIMALSDRIAVMYKGAILDILPAKEATREKLGLLMAGVKA